MNLEQLFLDSNSNPFAGKKILFTPISIPQISASYLTTADSYQFVTDANGMISASIVPNNYSVQVSEPLTPVTNYYLTATDTGSFIISGSAPTGSAQIVVFDLQNIVMDYTTVKKLEVSPAWNYPFNFSGSTIVLTATGSIPNITGSLTYDALVPGIYKCDAYGKVITTFHISVPTYSNIFSIDGSWNAKDLRIVKPSKGIPVRVNNADNSYVLTVSSSDARYIQKGGEIDNALTASYASSSVSSSHALFADTASVSTPAAFNGNRPITRDDPDFQGINVGGDTVNDFLDNFFFPFVEATVNINSGTTYYETGSTEDITVNGTITPNTETIFGTGSVYKDGSTWNVIATIPPYPYSFNDIGVSQSHTYYTEIQVSSSLSTIISSSIKHVTFISPFLYGLSSTPGLAGSSLYVAMNEDIAPVGNKSYAFNGTNTYLYFAYPASYPDLQHILDPNLFQVLGSTTQVIAPVVGLSGYTTNYKIYQWQTLADFNGTFQFQF